MISPVKLELLSMKLTPYLVTLISLHIMLAKLKESLFYFYIRIQDQFKICSFKALDRSKIKLVTSIKYGNLAKNSNPSIVIGNIFYQKPF